MLVDKYFLTEVVRCVELCIVSGAVGSRRLPSHFGHFAHVRCGGVEMDSFPSSLDWLKRFEGPFAQTCEIVRLFHDALDLFWRLLDLGGGPRYRHISVEEEPLRELLDGVDLEGLPAEVTRHTRYHRVLFGFGHSGGAGQCLLQGRRLLLLEDQLLYCPLADLILQLVDPLLESVVLLRHGWLGKLLLSRDVLLSHIELLGDELATPSTAKGLLPLSRISGQDSPLRAVSGPLWRFLICPCLLLHTGRQAQVAIEFSAYGARVGVDTSIGRTGWHIRRPLEVLPAFAADAAHALSWGDPELKSSFLLCLAKLHLGATVRLCGAATATEFAAYRPLSRAFATQRAITGETSDNRRQRRLFLVHSEPDKILLWALRFIYLFCIVVPAGLSMMISKV